MHHVKYLTRHCFCHAALLRDRSLNPYTPPVLWLQMTRGAMDVFKAARKWMVKIEDSIASRLTKRKPVLFDDKAKFGVSNRRGPASA